MNLKASRPREFDNPTFDSIVGTPNMESVFQHVNPATDWQGDWGWGNRFDFGWVSEEGTGLWMVARKLDGPNERISYDNIDTNLDQALRLDNEPWGPTFATVNGLKMWGFEMNKIWRLSPTPNGTVMEPFIGPRYVKLRDVSDRADAYSDAAELLRFGLGTPGLIEQRTLTFNYQETFRTTDNDLFGGQFGMRSRWRRGRWQITSDIRGLAFWNHQVRETRRENEIQQEDFIGTYVDNGLGLGNGVLGTIAPVGGVDATLVQDFRQTHITESNNTFVYGGELNLQAAFDITQGFAITFGGEVLAFADGIGRGATGIDDSLVLTGFSLGFTINR